ncbi:MAG: DUF1932 domain-containing protein [Candidatus Latescibacterota bacterium]|nr:DUF1932 domain-containing protein [Candidatus Latescibacterota bacterium]
MDVRLLGDEIGAASAFKMCYAAQTKGRYSIFLESLVAAEKMGLYDALVAELEGSQSSTLEDTRRSVPGIPGKSGRWIGEMEEIATTFADLGLTSQIFAGVADLYRFVTDEAAGHTADADADPEEKLRALVSHLARARG